jgi:Holliday junction resolvase-like predicted endonuclease
VGRGELDLVVRMHGRRVAVEVKTVGPARQGAPVDRFDPPKAATVRRLANRLRPPATRVDFVGVRVCDGGVRVRWLPGVD